MKKSDDFDDFFEEEDDNQEINALVSDIDLEYEYSFYEYISKTKDIYIIPFPDTNGTYPSSKDIKNIVDYCRQQKLKVLYRVSHRGSVSTIVDKDTKITGILPDFNDNGFPC